MPVTESLVIHPDSLSIWHMGYGVQYHHDSGSLASFVCIRCRGKLQSFFLWIMFKDTWPVSPDVTITLQFGLCDLTHLHLHIKCRENTCRCQLPHGTLFVIQRHHLHTERSTTPALVTQHIGTHAVFIGSTTKVRSVQWHTIDHQSDVPVMVLLGYGKHRTVRGL